MDESVLELGKLRMMALELTIGNSDLPIDRRPELPPGPLAQGTVNIRALSVPFGVLICGCLQIPAFRSIIPCQAVSCQQGCAILNGVGKAGHLLRSDSSETVRQIEGKHSGRA